MTPWLDPADVFGQPPGDVLDILSILGIDGDVSGTELTACCPMHTDRRPSFGVNIATGAWHCFTGCGSGGGGLAWLVALATGVRMEEAKAWLGEGSQSFTAPEPDDNYDIELNEWYGEEEWLRGARPPADALAARGISAEAADALSIRWGKTWNPEIRTTTWASGWQLPIRQMTSPFKIMGHQTKISGSEFNEDGVWTTPGTRKRLSLFGVDVYEPGRPVVLVESPLDVAVLLTAGIEGGLASYGRPSRQQLAFLADHAGPVVLAMDNDRDGKRYTDDLLSNALLAPVVPRGVYVFSYSAMPDAKDPGDMHVDHAALRAGMRRAEKIHISRFMKRGHR